MRTVEPAIAHPVRFRAGCIAGVLVGRAVYISSAPVAGLYQVAVVDIDATDIKEATATGLIVSKPTSTTCVVQAAGILSGVLSGLTPGARHFVATDGTLTSTPPSRPATGKRVIQSLAYALANDVALIRPSSPVRVVAE